MKLRILSILLKEIKEKTSSEQFKKLEDIILDIAESSGDPKTIAAAKMLRMILKVED